MHCAPDVRNREPEHLAAELLLHEKRPESTVGVVGERSVAAARLDRRHRSLPAEQCPAQKLTERLT